MQNYKIYLRRNNITQVIYADENVYAPLSSLFSHAALLFLLFMTKTQGFRLFFINFARYERKENDMAHVNGACNVEHYRLLTVLSHSQGTDSNV